MRRRRTRVGGLVLALAMLTLASSWLAGSLAGPPRAAAQAQPPPPRPSPTAVVKTPEEDLRDTQIRKLEHETRLIDDRRDRIRQLQDIDRQAWRAPAAAVAAFGPTLVGLGLLYLLARALSYWLPSAQRRTEPPTAEDEDDEEL